MDQGQFERCPACGQPVQSSAARACELCGYEFVDQRVTNTDVTPYADAYSRNEPGFLRMLRWVVFARAERMKHLGLMRSSAASTRFAWFAILWYSLAVSLHAFSQVGWREVGGTGGGAPAVLKPSGGGWLRVSATATLPKSDAGTQRALWWNPAQGLIAAAAAFVGAIGLSWVCLGALRWGATLAHTRAFRSEGRMAAALAYSIAFLALCLVGGVVISIRPISYVLRADSAARPSSDAIAIVAAITAGAPLMAWWLWLIRLGSSAPAVTRGRVAAFMIAAPPLCVAAMAVALYWGFEGLDRLLFPAMHLQY